MHRFDALAATLDRPACAPAKSMACPLEPRRHLGEIGHDELPGEARCRGSDVRREVAERRVLLVADRRHDRHAAGRDRADEPLVAEREQILEAASATCDDDDVAAGVAEHVEGVDDRTRGARPLHVRLGDDDVRGREPRCDHGEHVALRRGVVAGDEPDRPRQERKPAFPLRREQALGGELLFQALDRREQVAGAEPLDRERPQTQLAPLLVQLRPAVDVDPLAVAQVEAKPVKLPARHLDAQAGAVAGILEREEHTLPARLPSELGHLALDPDRRGHGA